MAEVLNGFLQVQGVYRLVAQCQTWCVVVFGFPYDREASFEVVRALRRFIHPFRVVPAVRFSRRFADSFVRGGIGHRVKELGLRLHFVPECDNATAGCVGVFDYFLDVSERRYDFDDRRVYVDRAVGGGVAQSNYPIGF